MSLSGRLRDGIEASQWVIDEVRKLEAQLEASTKKTDAWREFGQSVGDPFRAKCGHLVNRGWRCLVCGADPTD